jgi:regulator of protease activity HflC (stomatin/prohibitin superfamily)
MESLYVLLVMAVGIIVVLFKGIRVVSQGEEWVVERLGKYLRNLKPGLNLIIPFMDVVREKVSTRDIILDIPQQEVITSDNAVILANAMAFIRVTRPQDAIYGVEDFQAAIRSLIMTTLRSIIGEMSLDEALSNRTLIKTRLKNEILDDLADWGVTVKSVEIQDITPSASMQHAMEQQAAAERERRAVETRAEGTKNAMVLEAQGRLEAAVKEAEAQVALAKASSIAIANITKATDGKEFPAMFLLGDRYIESLNKLSTSPNSKFVVYPADLQATIKGMMGSLFSKG